MEGLVAGLGGVCVGVDRADSRLHDLRDFDGHAVGRLETAMWRSYYEHRPLRLLGELSELLRCQYHLPFWRSCAGAYYAAHAAELFQAGTSRSDYERALPDLRRYYSVIRRSSMTDFDVNRVAVLELEWWIVHRERAKHSPAELYHALAELQAAIYEMPGEPFAEHARIRGDAMLLRDARGTAIVEGDWRRIAKCWTNRGWQCGTCPALVSAL
jgi:hypothetical protein